MKQSTTTKTSTMNVSQIILEQLGGNKFLAMTGAWNLQSDESALTMHLPKNQSKAKFLRIEINMNDTYNMIFRSQDKKTYQFPIVNKSENVYADMLKKIFTEVTGLETHL